MVRGREETIVGDPLHSVVLSSPGFKTWLCGDHKSNEPVKC